MKKIFLTLTLIMFFSTLMPAPSHTFASPKKSCLRLMSYNVALLPFPIGIPFRLARTQEIIKKIKALPIQKRPHFIAFQEVFDEFSRIKLINDLKALYPHSYSDDKNIFQIGSLTHSGLTLLSQFPILHRDLYRFTLRRGAGNYARKGVMGVVVELSSQQKLALLNTHLQAGNSGPLIPDSVDRHKPNSSVIRQKNLEQVALLALELHSLFDLEGSFLLGDFNIDIKETEYAPMMKILFEFEDSYRPELSPLKGSTHKKGVIDNQRLDYIFQGPYSISGHSIIMKEFGPEESDHFAVWGEFCSNSLQLP